MLELLAAEGHGNGFWLPHDINEVYWGTAAFLIVFGLLYVKAGPFIRKGLAARPERIAAELDAAASARSDAEAQVAEVKDALADSDKEAARIVEEARETAARITADYADRGDAEAAAIREQGVAEIAATRRQAQAELVGEVTRIAAGAAERVVESNLDDATHQQLIDDYISQLGSKN